MWSWILGHGLTIMIVLFGIRFLYKDLPVLIHDVKNTSNNYSDDDPSGNDNIGRSFHNYM